MQKTVNVETTNARATTMLEDTTPTVPLPDLPQGLMVLGPQVTLHFVEGEWNQANSYDYYDVVQVDGTSYIAVQDVPANTPITNTDYWAKWNDPNAQVELLQETVGMFDSRISAAESDAEAANTAATAAADFNSNLKTLYAAIGQPGTTDDWSFIPTVESWMKACADGKVEYSMSNNGIYNFNYDTGNWNAPSLVNGKYTVDCMQFALMVSQGITYESSMASGVSNLAVFNGDDFSIYDKDVWDGYIYEEAGRPLTYMFAERMNNSGRYRSIKGFSSMTVAEKLSILNQLKPGDIIFEGDPSNPEYEDRFQNIYHAGVFIGTGHDSSGNDIAITVEARDAGDQDITYIEGNLSAGTGSAINGLVGYVRPNYGGTKPFKPQVIEYTPALQYGGEYQSTAAGPSFPADFSVYKTRVCIQVVCEGNLTEATSYNLSSIRSHTFTESEKAVGLSVQTYCMGFNAFDSDLMGLNIVKAGNFDGVSISVRVLSTQPVPPRTNMTMALLKSWAESERDTLVSAQYKPWVYFTTTDDELLTAMDSNKMFTSGYMRVFRQSSTNYGVIVKYHPNAEQILVIGNNGSSWSNVKYNTWTATS